MYKEKLTLLIMEAMKAKNTLRLQTLRTIKSAFQLWETDKANVGKDLDTATELQIIRKLANGYREEAASYNDGKHDELIKDRLMYAEDLEEMLPQAATESEVEEVFLKLKDLLAADGIEPVKKNMGVFVKNIKQSLPTADGKMVAMVVQKHLS